MRINLGNLGAFKAEELREYKFYGDGAGDPESGGVPRSWQLGEESLQVHGCGEDEIGRRLFQQVQQEVRNTLNRLLFLLFNADAFACRFDDAEHQK